MLLVVSSNNKKKAMENYVDVLGMGSSSSSSSIGNNYRAKYIYFKTRYTRRGKK